MSIDLKDMLKAGVHFGHKTSRWSPKMKPYIWGSNNKVHLIDISKTAFLLERAGKFLKDLAANGKSFLFVGTKRPAQDGIKRVAQSLEMPFVINRWIGGTLSNYDQVKKAITRLLYLRDVVNKPSTSYKKKEIVMIQKEVERLEKNVGGIIDLAYPPSALIVVDAKREHSAIKEASSLNIPVIGLVDTNTDPDGISFVIPANDDSPKSIDFVLEYLGKCVEEGRQLFENAKEQERTARAKEAAAKLEAKKAAPAVPAVKKEAVQEAPVEKTAPAK